MYAYMWTNLASSSGFEMARKLHQLLAKKMTFSHIDKAQDLTGECIKKNIKHVRKYATFHLFLPKP